MKKIIITTMLFHLISCQKNKTDMEINKNNMETPQCLISQIQAGSSAEKSETDYPNYVYNEGDLQCSLPILELELKNRGYHFLSNEEFEKKFLVFLRERLTIISIPNICTWQVITHATNQ